MTRRVRALASRCAVGILVLGLLAGCAGGGPTIDPAVQHQLRQDVGAVASAVAGHHPARARAALDALNADTAAARAAGKIDASRLARIRSAAAALTQDLDRLTTSAPATVTLSPIGTRTPTVTVTTAAAPPHSPAGPKTKGGHQGKPGQDKHGQGPSGDQGGHDKGDGGPGTGDQDSGG